MSIRIDTSFSHMPEHMKEYLFDRQKPHTNFEHWLLGAHRTLLDRADRIKRQHHKIEHLEAEKEELFGALEMVRDLVLGGAISLTQNQMDVIDAALGQDILAKHANGASE